MPLPLDTRKRPADVKVHLKSGAGVDITWSDAHNSHFEFAYLRELCPCALCNDEREKKFVAESAAHSANSATNPSPPPPGFNTQFPALPIFKPRPTALVVKPAGHYALHMEFSDGHGSGIYSYEYLREICPCEDCAKLFRS